MAEFELVAPGVGYENGPTGNIDASDVKLCEYNGMTYISYDFGNQNEKTPCYGGYGLALYNGSMQDLFRSFFK